MKSHLVPSLFAILALLMTACSSWQQRAPSSYERRNKEADKAATSFNAFYNYSPSRKNGGEWIVIQFEEPKSISELSFEYVNFPVRIHQVEVITATGQRLPIPKLSGKMLREQSKYLVFEGFNADLKIERVRLRAEGYENSNVLFTVSLFSADGFSRLEQQQMAQSSQVHGFSLSAIEDAQQSKIVPSCVHDDPALKDYLFNFDDIHSEAQVRIFCQRFAPQFKAWAARNPKDAQLLSQGKLQHRPLIVIGHRFAFDTVYNELFLPLQFQATQSTRLSAMVEGLRNPRTEMLARGPDIQLDLGYEEFMRSGLAETQLSYGDDWSEPASDIPADYCLRNFAAKGLSAAHAKRYCQQIVGFENGHFQCLDRLVENHFPLSQAHGSCLEARGKWSSYLPCVNSISELKFSYYDTHQFCVRTPEKHMTGQIACVEKLREQKFSAYRTLQSCQSQWGEEDRFLRCLDSSQRQPANDDERLKRCLK